MKASEIRELLKLLDQPDIISRLPAAFRTRRCFRPMPSGAPLTMRLRAQPRAGALQYSTSEGHAGLREWIAGEMARYRRCLRAGKHRDYSGIAAGARLSRQACSLSPRDTALVGWPTYLGALQAFSAYEPNYDRLEPMGNRAPGDFAWQAREKGGAVKFAYVSPDFANPTGETLTPGER